MAGLSKRQFKSPTKPGSLGVGGASIPDPVLLALGKAMAEWGFLEQQIDALLSASIGNVAVARALRVETRRQHRPVLKAIVQAMDGPDTKETLRLVGEYTSLALERNLYAHGVWGSHSGHPDAAILLLDDAITEITETPMLDRLDATYDPRSRVMSKMALITVADLKRFHDECDRVTGEIVGAVHELSMPPAYRSRPTSD